MKYSVRGNKRVTVESVNADQDRIESAVNFNRAVLLCIARCELNDTEIK
jgi:hypothetical protein